MPIPSTPGQRSRQVRRRYPGELTLADFLRGLLDGVQARLPAELHGLSTRHDGALIKLFAEEPAIHFELWLHRGRERVELGLHFETPDADRNRRLLEYVADDLLFLKHALGQGVEAEPWDKGWARVYVSYPLERLGADEQARLVVAFAEFIEVLEPIRREAVEAV